MITRRVQRWRDRRGSYRPAGECFDPGAFDVALIRDDASPRAFVERHHYSASYPAARVRVGLFERGELVGVAVFSVPMRAEVLRPFPADAAAELGRFVLLDRIRANGESWFLARAFELLRGEGYAGVAMFSDPVARLDADGRVVLAGHVGTIYQATNATYVGRNRPHTLRLFADGTECSNRALSKIRGRERGWEYAVAALVAHGAAPPAPGADLAAWQRAEVPRVTRKVRHPGKHKYLFALDRAARRALPASQPYPKLCLERGAA